MLRLVAVLPCILLTGSEASGHSTGSTALPPDSRSRGLSVQCAASSADADEDGLADACERELARVFAPQLVADVADCLWEASQTGGGRLRGGYFYAVAGNGVRGPVLIVYLPAYFRDCGWSGVPRALRFGRRNAHDGDSEMVIVEVAPRERDRWETTGVFLSAHCGGRSAGRCRWFRGRDLDAFEWHGDTIRGAPRIWVARGKHANYPSRDACESGYWLQERCASRGSTYRFPVISPAQNIGSRDRPTHAPSGCITSETLPLGPAATARGARECLWRDDSDFRGWQGTHRGAAPAAYGALMREWGGL